MRLFFALILSFLLTSTITAQEESQTPYEIALQRIEEARLSGEKRLYLSELALTELPPEIGDLSNLTYLDISENHLSTLPPEIGNLINLRWLDVSTNLLTSLPPEIGQLTNLRVLYLGGNQLTELPPEIVQLNQLRMLWLSGNQLTSLPPEIGTMQRLCDLNINNNQLNTLPVELSQVDGLTSNDECIDSSRADFRFENNPFILIPPEVVAGGRFAVMDYLYVKGGYHIQRSITWGASAVGIISLSILAFRWHNNRRKGKRKNE